MSSFINRVGERYGMLVVESFAGNGKWKCICDCGNEVIVRSGNLTYGNTKSCGCLNDYKRHNSCITHGDSYSRLYKIYHCMKDRCYLHSHKEFYRYGGRGIVVCDEWKDSYQRFKDWAMASGYSEDLTLDRVDNDGPYAPWNCKWSTRQEQNNNRSDTKYISYTGECKSLANWCRELNLNYRTVWARLFKYGYSVEKAFGR